MSEKLICAAEAVIKRWNSPQWNWGEPTASLIHELRTAVDAARQQGRDERIEDFRQIADWADEALNNDGYVVMVRRLEEIADAARALTQPQQEG